MIKCSLDEQSGFTLVEVILIVVLISILAAVVIPRFFAATKKAKVQSCEMNRSIINKQVELYFITESTWPLDNLNDIKGNQNYFPDGIPTCPVDMTSYQLWSSPYHRVQNHVEGAGTHSFDGANPNSFGFLGLSFPNNLGGWNTVSQIGAGTGTWSSNFKGSAFITTPNLNDTTCVFQAPSIPLSNGTSFDVTFNVPSPTMGLSLEVFTNGMVPTGDASGIMGAVSGNYTLHHQIASGYPAGYFIGICGQNVDGSGTGFYITNISVY